MDEEVDEEVEVAGVVLLEAAAVAGLDVRGAIAGVYLLVVIVA